MDSNDGKCNSIYTCLVTFAKIVWVGMALYGAGLTLYWIADSEPPVTIFGATTHNQYATRGMIAGVDWTYRQDKICRARSVRTLNGQCGSYTVFDGHPSGHITERDVAKIRFRIPESADLGICYYNTIITYKCNPIQFLYPITLQLPTIVFEVVTENEYLRRSRR